MANAHAVKGHAEAAAANLGKIANTTSRQLGAPYEVSKEEVMFIEMFYLTFLGALFGVIGIVAGVFYWKNKSKNSKAFD